VTTRPLLFSAKIYQARQLCQKADSGWVWDVIGVVVLAFAFAFAFALDVIWVIFVDVEES
jgi:hypothetical protein